MAINLIIALNFIVFMVIAGSRMLYSLYALHLGASPTQIGAMIALLYLFPLLSWPIGVVCDRFGARWPMVAGLVTGGIGMLAPLFWRELWTLYVAVATLGVTMAIMSVVGQNLIGALSKPGERAKNYNNFTLFGAICNFLGPVLTGVLIDHAGFLPACFAVAAPLFLCVAMLLVWGRLFPGGERHRSSATGNVLQTLADPKIRTILAYSSIGQVAIDLYQTFLPIYAHGVGLSASQTGVVLSAMAIGSFGIRLVMLRLITLLGEQGVLSMAFYAGAAAFALIPFAQGTWTLFTLALVFGMFWGLSAPITMMVMFNQVQKGSAGAAIGLRLTVNNLIRIMAPVLFGAVAAGIGLKSVFWLNGAVTALGGWLSRPDKPLPQRD